MVKHKEADPEAYRKRRVLRKEGNVIYWTGVPNFGSGDDTMKFFAIVRLKKDLIVEISCDASSFERHKSTIDRIVSSIRFEK